jgi:hypothetical protein
MNHWRRLAVDERGSVLSAEVVLLTTLLAIGVIVGAKSFRDSAVTEFADFAQAIANLDQSYNVPNVDLGGGVFDVGSGFQDLRDFCDEGDDDGPTMGSNAKLNSTFPPASMYGLPATPE